MCKYKKSLQQQGLEKLAKINTTILIVLVLAGCQSTSTTIAQKRLWRIEQNVAGIFTYCQTGLDCPERTQKTLVTFERKPHNAVPEVTLEPSRVVAQVYFTFAKANLTPSAEKILLKALPDLKEQQHIFIRGWTDPVSGKNSRINQQLSQKRAEAVKNWLAKKGINSSSISIESQPPCCNKAGATAKSPDSVRARMRTVTIEVKN